MRWLLSILAQFFRWLASRNELATSPEGQIAAQRAREDAEAAKVAHDVAAAQKAIRSGDAAKVNETLRKHGMLLVAGVACLLLAGCASSKVVYIEREDAAVRMPREGRPGWWLPDATFARLMEKAIRNDVTAKEVKP